MQCGFAMVRPTFPAMPATRIVRAGLQLLTILCVARGTLEEHVLTLDSMHR